MFNPRINVYDYLAAVDKCYLIDCSPVRRQRNVLREMILITRYRIILIYLRKVV